MVNIKKKVPIGEATLKNDRILSILKIGGRGVQKKLVHTTARRTKKL
jgi:hypothetical protein